MSEFSLKAHSSAFRLVLACLCLLVSHVYADNPAPPKANPETQIEAKSGTARPSLKQLAFEMAESTYRVHPSSRNLSNLILTAELLIAESCYPDLLTTLSYVPSKRSERCSRQIEDTLAIDDGSPAALCARDGFESRSCTDAYSQVQIEVLSADVSPYPEEAGSKTGLDLDSKIESERLPSILGPLETRLANEELALRSTIPRDPALIAKIDATVSEILDVSCRDVRLSIRKRKTEGNILDPQDPAYNFQAAQYIESVPPEERDAALKQLLATSVEQAPAEEAPKPFDEIVNRLSNKKAEIKTKQVGQYVRIRYISNYCDRYLERANITQNGKASAACARYGNYSPACLDALRDKKMKDAEVQITPAGKSSKSIKLPPIKKSEKNAPANKGFSTF